ncbi:MAG: hypothetical protein R3E82_10465 [Pseudomonadales bacterium]
MNSRRIWGSLILIYGLFFFWYTSFGGPLTPAEIDEYIGRLETRGAAPEELMRLREFLESDTGDDFVMMNVIQLKDTPVAVPGISPGESSAEVLERYMAYMWPALLSRACHPVIMGQAAAQALDVWGIDGHGRWSQAAFMRYRSRRDLLEIAGNPDFQDPHEFKIAAMARTIAFPADPWFHAGDPRLLLALLLTLLGLLLDRLVGRAPRGRSGA